MKISFHLIHSYQEEALKVIGKSLHLTLQDDLYIEIDLKTSLEFISILHTKKIGSENNICSFEIEIDEATYDLSKYDIFIEGLLNKLKDESGFVRIIKYIDEIRNTEYEKLYSEIAFIEMKLREVFSFIFYSKYNVEQVDVLEEYDIKYPSIKPTVKDFENRSENPFFYFTFTGYYQFDKPKELPVKDIIPLIQTNEQYDTLRSYLNLRGILEERHIDFLKGIREKLSSIETVRNCVAHNRAIPKRALLSYEKVKPEVHKFIEDFWIEENRIEQENPENEINFAEQYSYDRLKELLSVAEWNEYNNEVVICDFWQQGTPEFKFNSLLDLKSYLIDISDSTADGNFPSNKDDRETYEKVYNGEILVDKVLNEYKRELIVLEWI